MKTRCYELICLLAICGLFFLYRPTNLYAQPSVNLIMPKTNLVPGDSLVLDLEMKTGGSSVPIDLYFSLEVGIFTFYMNQNLEFISNRVPVVSKFKPMDFKVRLFGPGTLFFPSVFGDVKIPENAQGSFIWTVEILDSTTKISLSKGQVFFTISFPILPSTTTTTSTTTTSIPATTTTSTSTTTTSIPANRPPTATITANPKSGEAPLTVNFTVTVTDPDGDRVVSFFWDFGDGTASSETNPTHTFSKPGTYKVTLAVIDERGLSSTASIVVESAAPTIIKTFNLRIRRFGDEADSVWTIRFDRTEFQITVITSEFFFCPSGNNQPTFVQGTKQFGVSSFAFELSQSMALILVEGEPDGVLCTTLKKGVIVKGHIERLPSWFNPTQPFTMFFNDSSVEVR